MRYEKPHQYDHARKSTMTAEMLEYDLFVTNISFLSNMTSFLSYFIIK